MEVRYRLVSISATTRYERLIHVRVRVLGGRLGYKVISAGANGTVEAFKYLVGGGNSGDANDSCAESTSLSLEFHHLGADEPGVSSADEGNVCANSTGRSMRLPCVVPLGDDSGWQSITVEPDNQTLAKLTADKDAGLCSPHEYDAYLQLYKSWCLVKCTEGHMDTLVGSFVGIAGNGMNTSASVSASATADTTPSTVSFTSTSIVGAEFTGAASKPSDQSASASTSTSASATAIESAPVSASASANANEVLEGDDGWCVIERQPDEAAGEQEPRPAQALSTEAIECALLSLAGTIETAPLLPSPTADLIIEPPPNDDIVFDSFSTPSAAVRAATPQQASPEQLERAIAELNAAISIQPCAVWQ